MDHDNPKPSHRSAMMRLKNKLSLRIFQAAAIEDAPCENLADTCPNDRVPAMLRDQIASNDPVDFETLVRRRKALHARRAQPAVQGRQGG